MELLIGMYSAPERAGLVALPLLLFVFLFLFLIGRGLDT